MATYDVVIFGVTFAGLMAAMRAEQRGATVAVVGPGTRKGGMVTSGLSANDKTSTRSKGYMHDFLVTAAALFPGSADGNGENFLIPSSDAMNILDGMLATHPGVTLVTAQELLAVNVALDGSRRRIVSIDVTGGNYAATAFIDCSYEGDLAAAAGVTMAYGRDSNRMWGEEPGAGYRPTEASVGTSPITDAAGFRVPFSHPVQHPDWWRYGDADSGLMAFSFRPTITKHASRLPVAAPAGYNAAHFKGLLNRLAAHPTTLFDGGVVTLAQLALKAGGTEDQRKSDMNGTGYFSTSVATRNAGWATAGPAARESIRASVYYYQAGMLYFLAHDAGVPGALQTEVNLWGLCADEFQDAGNYYGQVGWPRQVYVRESRRMYGAQYVLSMADRVAPNNSKPDSICTAGYQFDAHHTRRYFKSATDFYYEGFQGIVTASGVYAIPMRSVMPWPGQCCNLLNPVTPGVSRVMMTTYRLEETYGMAGETCGLWAGMSALAGEDTCDMSYTTLRAQMDLLGYSPDP